MLIFAEIDPSVMKHLFPFLRGACLLSAIAVAALLLLPLSCGTTGKSGLQRYRLEVVAEYPHDPSSYTQGLFFHEGALIESSGQYGESALRRVDLATGHPTYSSTFEGGVFAEGAVVFGEKLYVLTWENGQVYVCDPASFAVRDRLPYPREGWGLTTDGSQLIASDGSEYLYFLDGDLQLLRQVKVTRQGKPQRLLNELEYIDGKVWANVYTTDEIVIINPANGHIDGVVDCFGLLPLKDRDVRTDVLNGIACDPATGKTYLTGKYWKKLYEIKLVKR